MKEWNEKTKLEKAMDIISAIALCVWLAFEALEKSNAVSNAALAAQISICVVCICEAISFWNVKRALSYVAIGGVILIVATIVLEKFLLA